MQRDVDLLRSSVPLYDCPPKVHLDPDFQVKSVMEVYVKYAGWKEEDARAAAIRVVGKCRRACTREGA